MGVVIATHPFETVVYVDVSQKIGVLYPKMDGEHNEKHPIKMDDLGVPLFLETPMWVRCPI